MYFKYSISIRPTPTLYLTDNEQEKPIKTEFLL